MSQPGSFAVDERYARLNERDPLVKLNQLMDWEACREPLSMIHNTPRKSQAGRRPCDVVLMFKILVFQCLYNVSDLPAAGRPPGFVLKKPGNRDKKQDH